MRARLGQVPGKLVLVVGVHWIRAVVFGEEWVRSVKTTWKDSESIFASFGGRRALRVGGAEAKW